MEPDKDYKERLESILLHSQLRNDLNILRNLDSIDGWIGGGAVRNIVWDSVFGIRSGLTLNDVDVLHYSPNLSEAFDKELENHINKKYSLKWSIKNQFLMIQKYKVANAHSIKDAIQHWVETATAVAIQLNSTNSLDIICPYGLHDLFNGIVRPTTEEMRVSMNNRIKNKQWLLRWTELRVL